MRARSLRDMHKKAEMPLFPPTEQAIPKIANRVICRTIEVWQRELIQIVHPLTNNVVFNRRRQTPDLAIEPSRSQRKPPGYEMDDNRFDGNLYRIESLRPVAPSAWRACSRLINQPVTV